MKLIITRKYNHMREEKSKQTEGGKKNHAKQYHHKYEICLMEMIKKEFISDFAYPKYRITCSMKRRGKEDEKRKKRFIFCDC